MDQNKNQTYYKLEITSLSSNDHLLNYLKKFPCLGKKYINVLVYQRLHGYIDRGQHLNFAGLKKIKKLCYRLKK
jgi:hypothetical protein